MEVIFTLSEIADAAKTLLSNAGVRSVFALHGEMGAGKTTFAHACCDVLGVRSHISSPTFSIINQYITGENLTVYHIDLYRLKDETEARAVGVEDCLYSGDRCLVEWPERAADIFPPDTLHVHIRILHQNTRVLEFDPNA